MVAAWLFLVASAAKGPCFVSEPKREMEKAGQACWISMEMKRIVANVFFEEVLTTIGLVPMLGSCDRFDWNVLIGFFFRKSWIFGAGQMLLLANRSRL